MAKYDFIIAGLGTAGSATSMTLARRGYSVLGIDAFRPPHRHGSHHGASRSVRRAYLEGSSYVPMALRSWELWRKLEVDSAQQLLVSTANLTIGPPDCPAVSGFVQSAAAYQIPHEILSAAEIRKRWPQLMPPDDFVAGVEKQAGIVFPELSITTFLDQAAKAGSDLFFNQPLTGWNEGPDGVEVYAGGTTYHAARLLISAGSWTDRLLNLPAKILQPKRVPVHWLDCPDDPALRLGAFPVCFWQVPREKSPGNIKSFSEFYVLPITSSKGPGSKIKTAFHNGLDDCEPDNVDRQVVAEEVEKIRRMLRRFLPDFQHWPLSSEVCLYTMTADGHFYLGRRPGSEHVFGVALAGHGFKFAPVLGEILADLLTDITPEVDIALFSPQRFSAQRNIF
jgi:sarcosine oxidase